MANKDEKSWESNLVHEDDSSNPVLDKIIMKRRESKYFSISDIL